MRKEPRGHWPVRTAGRSIPAVSQDAYPGGLAGRITDSLSGGALEVRVGEPITFASSHVLLCGNSVMIKDAKLIL